MRSDCKCDVCAGIQPQGFVTKTRHHVPSCWHQPWMGSSVLASTLPPSVSQILSNISGLQYSSQLTNNVCVECRGGFSNSRVFNIYCYVQSPFSFQLVKGLFSPQISCAIKLVDLQKLNSCE